MGLIMAYTYKELLDKVAERKDQVNKFVDFLENCTSWLESPASTKYHLNIEGGLIKHSVNVANTLLTLRNTLAENLSDESCLIVGLFHDVGKVGLAGKPYYLKNNDEWQRKNRNMKYIVNNELVHLDISSRSLSLIIKYIDLYEDEIQAIRYHDGQYIDENKSVAHKETKLTRLLQYADNWSGGVLEENV